MSRKPAVAALAILLGLPGLSAASSGLFFFEAQAVAGYSSAGRKAVFSSHHPREAMQKPSLGFDSIIRLSGSKGDFAVLALQGRLAWNEEGEQTLEPQLYNASLRLKAGFADVWLGHSRPESGLASILDSHGLLLQPLSMNGFGFDRDWGLGLKKPFSRGAIGLSLTTGSGMPLHFKGNYLVSGRVSWGVLEQDNRSIGLSFSAGRQLETMGYNLLSPEPVPVALAGVDLTHFFNNIENRVEVVAGSRDGRLAYAVFWRAGLNLLEEGRLKVEVQPVFGKADGEGFVQLSAGLAYLASPDLTLRSLFLYDREMKDWRFVLQLYFYKRIAFL